MNMNFWEVARIHLEWVGSLISIKFAMRSSIPCCRKPIFSWKICLDGAGPLSCQPRGVSTQECFSATSSQRLVSTLEVQSWARPKSKKDVHSIEKRLFKGKNHKNSKSRQVSNGAFI